MPPSTPFLGFTPWQIAAPRPKMPSTDFCWLIYPLGLSLGIHYLLQEPLITQLHQDLLMCCILGLHFPCYSLLTVPLSVSPARLEVSWGERLSSLWYFQQPGWCQTCRRLLIFVEQIISPHFSTTTTTVLVQGFIVSYQNYCNSPNKGLLKC